MGGTRRQCQILREGSGAMICERREETAARGELEIGGAWGLVRQWFYEVCAI